MQDKGKKTIRVALQGMDGRTEKTLALYLMGPCKSAGVEIVGDNDADVDMIDVDLPAGKLFLEKKLVGASIVPSILLTLGEIGSTGEDTGAYYVKKPVTQEAMLAVLDKIKIRADNKKSIFKALAVEDSRIGANDEKTNVEILRMNTGGAPSPKTPLKHYSADVNDRLKTSKHKTAMQMDEKSFAVYMNLTTSLDANSPEQMRQALYDPKEYFQGFFQSACKIATARGQVLELVSGWKQLFIFPHTQEIWLDADDKQLRAFSSINVNGTGNKMSVMPVNAKSVVNRDLEKFQSLESLTWKLACWTSRGRYPKDLDILSPVYLKHWPNFTRLLITPHAMRIAALLIDCPRTVASIAITLKIKPEYVLIFISATHAVGLLGQARRNADNVVQPPTTIKPPETHNIFGRILSKLRTSLK